MDQNVNRPAKKMAGKRALVTGARTGIGRAVGLELARQGAVVAFHYSHSSDGRFRLARKFAATAVKRPHFEPILVRSVQSKLLPKTLFIFSAGLISW